jgi:hypothetical protein
MLEHAEPNGERAEPESTHPDHTPGHRQEDSPPPCGSDLLANALDGAERGWSFTPTKGKRPFQKGWQGLPPSLPEQLQQWTADGNNLAIRTGTASGVVIVDVDQGGQVPPECTATICAKTPGCGLHLYYRNPAEGLGNSAGKLAPHVDVRGDNGCAIFPGSRHPNGGWYEWAEGCAPGERELADFPPALLERLHKPKAPVTVPVPPDAQPGRADSTPYLAKALADECTSVAGAPEGQRNDTLNRAAFSLGQLVEEGLPEQEVETRLLAAAHACGLGNEEASRTIASGLAKGKANPRLVPHTAVARNAGKAPEFILEGVPTTPPEPWGDAIPLGGMAEEPPPWPWDAMPPVLSEFGQALAQTHCLPDCMAGAAVLGVGSIALGNRAKVEIKPDHRQFGNLFFMVVSPVGSGKSPLVNTAKAPLMEWESEQRIPWKAEHDQWESRKRRIEAQIKGLAKQAEKDPETTGEELDSKMAELQGQIGDEPPKPTLFISDATSEAVGRRMLANGGAIGVLSGEARKVLAIAKGRYAEGGDIDLWLQGHAGDQARVDRVSKASYCIDEACLSALICTQPDSLPELGLSDALRESGFLARWLYIVPPAIAREYPVESIPRDVKSRYGNAIRGLLELAPSMSPDGSPAPHVIRMTPETFAFWKRYHDSIHREIAELANRGESGYQQWLSKLPETVARLALLFQVVNGNMGQPISQEVAHAVRVAEVLKVHARRAFASIGDTAEVSDARKTWQWIERNRGKLAKAREKEDLGAIEAVKPSDLARDGVAGIQKVADATDILDLLEERGWLQGVRFRREPGRKTKAHTLYFLRPDEELRGSD